MTTTTTSPSVAANDDTLEQLNSFLRGEISAIETYRQAMEKLHLEKNDAGVALLRSCMESHEKRMNALESEVRRRGGTPATGSGAWGAFARLVQGGADLLSQKTAVAALEEGEDHGLHDYERDVPRLDPATRAWFESTIYPEQRATHRTIRDFKNRLGST